MEKIDRHELLIQDTLEKLKEHAGGYKDSGFKETDAYSYVIFKRKHQNIIDEINKNPKILYLLYGDDDCGKTTILQYLFNRGNIKFPKSVFLKGKRITVPRMFFEEIGGKIEETKDTYLYGKIILRKLAGEGILFIDDFDDMLNNLGENFTAFLRSVFQEYGIGVVATGTTGLKLRKVIANYEAPFYRFFNPVSVAYENEDIKFLANEYNQKLDAYTEKILNVSNSNIALIAMMIQNFNGTIEQSIQTIIKKNPFVIEKFLAKLSNQQITILEYMCERVIEGKPTRIKDIVEDTLLDEKIVGVQVNRMVKKNFIKIEKTKKYRSYIPNPLFIGMKRYELCLKHILKGQSFKDLKRYEEAEKEYGEAIKINPNLAEAHNNLGLLLDDLNRYEEAEKEYREAIRINPNYAYAHYNLGILLKNLNRYEEAEKEYREAIRINPNYANAHNNLGNLLKNLNRYEEAEKEYREAIRINPNVAGAHNNLGNLLRNLNRYEEAEKEYREAIRINPNDAGAHYNLGILLKNLNRYEEAEKEYREAIRLNPNFAEAHNNLGVLLQNLKRYEEAEKEYREAIRINPNYADAHYNLACLYSVKNDLKKAIDWLKKAIEIDEKYKEMAKEDKDFENIKDGKDFKDAIGRV